MACPRSIASPAARTFLLCLALSVAAPAYAERADWVRKESFRLLNEGVAAVNRGDYREAVEKLRECTRYALNSFRGHYYLGLALIGDRRYEQAVQALEVALDLNPTHLQAHVALGDAYLALGDTEEARAEYFRTLKLRPEFPPALDGIGRVYEALGDVEQAESYFQRAIASNRGYADAYTHLGDLYLRTDRLDEAVRLLSEAVRVRPDFGPGLNRLAEAYARLGLANEAISTIRKAVALEPRNPDHRATLGWVQLERGLVANASSSFQAALALDPGHPRALEGLAEAARRQGRYGEAMTLLDRALEDPRLTARMRDTLTERRRAVEDEAARFETLQARVAAGEAGVRERWALAALYASRGRHDLAAETLAPAAAQAPELESTLAYYLIQAGRPREAIELYERLRSTGDPTAAFNRAVALARLGDDAEAAAAFRALASSAQAPPEARLYEGNALLRLGRVEEALEAYRAYLAAGGGGEAAQRVRGILEQLAPEQGPALPEAAASGAKAEGGGS